MKCLYIIGNGFDLHHGMETSYFNFREWLAENEESVLLAIDELFGCCDNDWWACFENNLAYAVTSDIVLEKVSENYPDFGSDNFRDADWYDAEFAVENKLSEVYGEIRKAFHQWIVGLKMGDKSKKIKLLTDNSVFLTFNYTETLEELYGIEDNNILHIHGKASSDCELVLGHGADTKIIKEILEKEYPKNDEGDDYVTQRAKDAAIAGVYSQRKDVESIISSHNKWFLSLKDVTHIYFYGHSLSEVDMPYFKKIFSVVDKNNIQIEISDYNGKDRGRIIDFMQSEGFRKEQYSIINFEDKLLCNTNDKNIV